MRIKTVLFTILLIFINNIWADVSLKEKIGQMFIVGFYGEQILEDIQDGLVGGVIIYDRNIESSESLKNLIGRLTLSSKIPLWVAADCEGGLIDRLKEKYGYQKSKKPIETGVSLNDVKLNTAILANKLKDSGFNLNLAPVVDKHFNDSTILGKLGRCFSDDIDLITKYSEVFIRQHTDNNICCVIKHFPGHGSSVGDSHHGYVDVTDTWSEDEMKPYQDLHHMKDLPIMVMTAHVVNRNLDSKGLPATLSKDMLTNKLRTELKYDGVILTDDLMMKAITNNYKSYKLIMEMAIMAGADMLMFSHPPKEDHNFVNYLVDTVLELVNEKKITEERIDESYRRILSTKEVYF